MPAHAGGDPPALRRARAASRLLDAAVTVPGTSVRVGLDPLLSVVPFGSLLGTLCSLYIVVEAARSGVPGRTLARMLANLAVDTAVGAVPLVGPFVDAAWRANERNVSLFERHVDRASDPEAFVGIEID
jgi:hypothetical protein